MSIVDESVDGSHEINEGSGRMKRLATLRLTG